MRREHSRKNRGVKFQTIRKKFILTEQVFLRGGHIDYTEPLTNAEVQEYELQPEKREFTVKFTPDNEQINRIHKLLLKWREYVAEDGTKPFAEYTIEKFFEVMMQSGSFHTMNTHIDNMKYELETK